MIDVTNSTFTEEVLQSPVPVLVDFWAVWCGPCRAAAPVIERVSKDFEGRAKVVKLDCDAFGETAVQYGVKGIPAFMIFKGGKKVAEFVGFSPDLEEKLGAALTAAL